MKLFLLIASLAPPSAFLLATENSPLVTPNFINLGIAGAILTVLYLLGKIGLQAAEKRFETQQRLYAHESEENRKVFQKTIDKTALSFAEALKVSKDEHTALVSLHGQEIAIMIKDHENRATERHKEILVLIRECLRNNCQEKSSG